jgi:signal transduction histidine kinase/ligand-binding sensor domain-containing protein
MKLNKRIDYFLHVLLQTIMLLFVMPIYGQYSNMKFDYLTTDNGLLSNRIASICRDYKGFVWIGSQGGLNRFDGYKLTSYINDSNNNKSISSNDINYILEDNNKDLWVGTSIGLNLYNSDQDNFEVFLNNPKDSNSINNNYIKCIYKDTKNNLWITTGVNGGIEKWIPEKRSFKHYRITNTPDDRMYNSYSSICEDKQGKLWIVSNGRGIVEFNPKTGKFVLHDDPNIDFGFNLTKRIYIDSYNTAWISTEGNGLFSYNIKTGKFKHIPVNENGSGTNGLLIREVIQVDNNHLFITVDQGGINILNIVTGKYEYCKFSDKKTSGLNNDGIWTIYKDIEGIIWVGTSAGGVNYYNPKKERFKLYRHSSDPNSVAYDAILCFYEDEYGKIWIGTDGGGLSIFDPVNKTFTNYKNNPADPNSLSSNVVISIDEDKDKNVWLGTWSGGLNKYDRKTNKFHRYFYSSTDTSTISSNNIWSLIVDAQNNLWISNFDLGIDVYNKKTGFVRRFKYDVNNTSSNNFFRCNNFYRGRSKIWIARDNTLSYIDTVDNSIKNFTSIHDALIRSLYEDKNGNIWVGTNKNGVLVYDSKGIVIKTLNTSNGLANNTMCVILEDNEGNLWFSTNNGLSKYNIKKQTFRNYTQNDGLQSNHFKEWAFLQSKTGEIYLGGYKGFNSFYPDSLYDNTYIPYVYISEFQIFNKTVYPGEPGSPLTKSISQTSEIVLSYKMSVFSFVFSAIGYTFPENSQYAYKMEGFDKDWNKTDASRRYVTYTNLDPGKYTFKVKATNNDGIWNEKGVSLEITILPPLWKTLWFKIAIVSFTLMVLFLIYYKRLVRIQKTNALLNKLVKVRTKEIEEKNKMLVSQAEVVNEANTLLEERQMQIEEQTEELMAQRDELSQLNATKDKLFSILAHDLRAPFNNIIGFSDLLLKNVRKYPVEKVELQLGFIREAATNTFNLLNNLLQWSRTQRGVILFEPENIIFSQHLENEMKNLNQQAHRKEITIEIKTDNDGIIINVDPNMINTVVRNLISNAIKYSHVKSKVIVEYKVIDNEFVFSVKDMGIGVSEELLHKLFSILNNASKQGTTGEEGTGLGLLLCKDFITKHNGKIWAESEEGKGSTFYFSLPYTKTKKGE